MQSWTGRPGENQYPRILLINAQGIGQKSGTGATLASLFEGWPRDRIAQILPEGSEGNSTICENNWFVSFPENWKRTVVGRRFLLNFPGRIRRSRGFPITQDLVRWVTDFAPQLVYSYLENPLITNLVARLTRSMNLAVVPHLMDDWHFVSKGAPLSEYWWFFQRRRDFKTILKRSPLGISISEEMEKEYRERYRIPFYTYMNCADPRLFCPSVKSEVRRGSLKLVYAGAGPGLGRWPIILALAEAVQELNRMGKDITFEVFSHIRSLKAIPRTGNGFFLHDFVDQERLASILSECDVAVLPEGFEHDHVVYSRLSLSAKLPLYLMSGSCVLAIGPVDSNSIRYVKNNDLGYVVHNYKKYALMEQLEEMFENQDEISCKGRHNRKFALAHHCLPTIQASFANLLSQTASWSMNSLNMADSLNPKLSR